MGAWFTTQTAAGKTPKEAYSRALESASAEYGHQEGYSGAINSKDGGFVLVDLPARFTYAKFQSLLEDYSETESSVEYAKEEVDFARSDLARATGRTAKAQAKRRLVAAERDLAKARKAFAKVEAAIPADLAYRFPSLARTYYDKWSAPLCVEIRGAEAKRYGYVSRKRGERLYIFFGYAPS